MNTFITFIMTHPDDMRDLLSKGYFRVNPMLWDYIPKGSHIRYVKRGGGRVIPGGFVQSHFKSNDKKMLMVGLPASNVASYPIAYDEIEDLWKKYAQEAFIEVQLIHNSLAQKKKQIEALTARVQLLEDILKRVVG